jgi:hypothetical protein
MAASKVNAMQTVENATRYSRPCKNSSDGFRDAMVTKAIGPKTVDRPLDCKVS